MDGAVSERVTMCLDGKYRWVYELSLFRNPTVLYTLIKVILVMAAIMLAIGFLIGLGDGVSEAAEMSAVMAGISLAVLLPLSLVGYAVYALKVGGKYCVVFEMDEEGVLHAQQEQQTAKAGLLSDIGILAGALSGNPTLAGASLLAKTHTSLYSDFGNARLVRPVRGRNTIYVDSNHVYVMDEDFDMVLDFIKSRCTGARIVGARRRRDR